MKRVLLFLWLVATGAGAAPEGALERLLAHAALPAHLAPPPDEPLTEARAHLLWRALLDSAPTARTFAPRATLAHLLRSGAPDSPRARAEHFRPLVVVRPDGYVCVALTGAPLAWLGPPTLVDGHLSVHHLRVGAFYFDRAGVFFAVDDALRPVGPPLAERPLGRDPATAALLGSQDAVEQVALALAHLLIHPVRSLEGLSQLPSGLAHLLATSPEYFARYGALPLETQVREASRLATHLLTLQGGLLAQGPRLAGAARLPVLTLSARGELVLGSVAAPVATPSLVAHAGAASLVFMAQGLPPPGGPGQWLQKPEGMSSDAQRYQSQVTGAPEGWVYRVRTGPGPKDFVDFDGFRDGVLLEAKGPGYQDLLRKMYGKDWFTGMEQLIDQARRQMRASTGAPLQWHFAEQEVAALFNKLLKEKGHGRVKVIHTPSRP
ncbi:Tox-REase-5 domain-containing protein [Melittangium boletus]|uniref:Tox-REase-5 domain-containing protein n=1 Tax=Melittangium boletus TaxID=83453 RepID=UPI003DA3B740